RDPLGTGVQTCALPISVRAVDVHEVLAYLGRQRPLVQECDLVEPAAPAGDRVAHDGVAALPRAQATAIPPLEVDRVGATVALDRSEERRVGKGGRWRGA